MLIAHISDSHVTRPGHLAYDVAPVGDLLAQVVEHINAFSPKVDLVVHTGDVTFSGRRDEAEEARRLLSQLRCPYFLIPGNHDNRRTLHQVFGQTACPAQADGFLNYTVDAFPLRLVALDSTRPDAPGGALCDDRAAWLRTRLAEAPERPTLLLLHHPPVNCGVLETDEDGFEGRGVLADIVAQYRCIQRILCGHIHLPAHAGWQGRSVSVAPATGLELRLDLTRSLPSAFHLSDPAYLMHYVPDNGPIVTHLVAAGPARPPHPFE